MDWNDFAWLEDQHYAAMFHDRYEQEEEPEEVRTVWEIEWESLSEDCMDQEEIEAESREEALEAFREEFLGESVPDDAVVLGIRQIA